jgi:hypothetical protein
MYRDADKESNNTPGKERGLIPDMTVFIVHMRFTRYLNKLRIPALEPELFHFKSSIITL